jgi:hypothetical protein
MSQTEGANQSAAFLFETRTCDVEACHGCCEERVGQVRHCVWKNVSERKQIPVHKTDRIHKVAINLSIQYVNKVAINLSTKDAYQTAIDQSN